MSDYCHALQTKNHVFTLFSKFTCKKQNQKLQPKPHSISQFFCCLLQSIKKFLTLLTCCIYVFVCVYVCVCLVRIFCNLFFISGNISRFFLELLGHCFFK